MLYYNVVWLQSRVRTLCTNVYKHLLHLLYIPPPFPAGPNTDANWKEICKLRRQLYSLSGKDVHHASRLGLNMAGRKSWYPFNTLMALQNTQHRTRIYRIDLNTLINALTMVGLPRCIKLHTIGIHIYLTLMFAFRWKSWCLSAN